MTRTAENRNGGDEGTRTPGLCLAKAALSQLSYIPNRAPDLKSISWNRLLINKIIPMTISDNRKSKPFNN